MIPVDDALLEACRDDNFHIDHVHCDGAEGDCADSAFVGWAVDVVLDLVATILF